MGLIPTMTLVWVERPLKLSYNVDRYISKCITRSKKICPISPVFSAIINLDPQTEVLVPLAVSADQVYPQVWEERHFGLLFVHDETRLGRVFRQIMGHEYVFQLVLRVLAAEEVGRNVEPGAGEVVRQVAEALVAHSVGSVPPVSLDAIGAQVLCTGAG